MKNQKISKERQLEIKKEIGEWLVPILDNPEKLEEEYFRSLLSYRALKDVLHKEFILNDIEILSFILLIERAYNSGIQVTPFKDSVYGKFSISMLLTLSRRFNPLSMMVKDSLSVGQELTKFYSRALMEMIEKSQTALDIYHQHKKGKSNKELIEEFKLENENELNQVLELAGSSSELNDCIQSLNNTDL